ncbi:MAG TPA: SDR family oxidoreductase [Thermoleophilaceae bacterium]|nr:SDR family oxidoreductase [Thermoleophilaceae bacterium]
MSTRILITGAASGIGEATAAALRRRGCSVVGVDLNPTDGVIACDVRDQVSVDSAVAQAVAELGGLDVLINSAGVGDPQSAAERPGEDALRVIDVNLLGTWRVTAAALDALRAAHGRVINISSGLAHLTIPLATAYTMSKRGVVAYSDSLRLEMAGEVSVTTVYPGYIRTPIHNASAAKAVRLEGVVPAEPLEAAAATLVKAALSPRAYRDLATSRQGAAGYAMFRRMPRKALDRLTLKRLRASAERGHFDESEMAAPLRKRLLRGA